ncbi:FAD-binding dehydrogenase [Micrococcus terreus]|uniref:FAD-binding dehydrogenase n=1 Tax=Micrococcus terreus TaxID=574650 RepID=UPI00254E5FB7|nr:FAD-binding dehydrogenase [Micrococcus terreus]MDK7700132.1 FAD-binding dehydrogenase [Micrococcus terreus]WOO97011.1 FAD-binding dehydrogenase [Micrococcus terreus]
MERTAPTTLHADVIVVGAGLAGLVAATEAADAGRSVLLLDQEGEQSLGAQAHWSLGGLFMVDTPEQRRLGVKDSLELAHQDWFGSAQFDRPEDHWPRAWAEAYLDFAAGEKRAWLREMGHRIFPVVGWAERGDGTSTGHGNSVPRFHITWGTGPGVVEPFERRLRQAHDDGRVTFAFRHRVDALLREEGAVVGVEGTVLAPDDAPRGTATTRTPVRGFQARGQAVIVTSGGIGGDLDLVRRAWPDRLGTPPRTMVAGVPAHVDGRMLEISVDAGARVINPDRMWHYVEGLRNWDPVWENHGIRILPGPSSLWLDAAGNRLPAPYYPGFDTLGTLRHLRGTGYDYSWFVLTQKIIEKEFALSGSEQNPDLTGRDVKLLGQRLKKGAPGPVEAFKRHGQDFVVAETVEQLVAGMNEVADADAPQLEVGAVRELIEARDREMGNRFTKDAQVTALRGARSYLGDRLIRVATPHRLLDPKAGPLIAVRLNILSRKTLGGLETDLQGRCLGPDGAVVPGLYAAGEVAGFGGGGMMGYNALEGTFLGGCLFSGRVAGRAASAL